MPFRSDGYIPPCIPTRAAKPPAGPDWVHEIKHDGYRLQVRREGDAVRLFTRRGYDWSTRYPAIAVTAARLRAKDLRPLPLGDRKKRLARLVGKRRVGIVLSGHTDEDGATIFQQACKMGLEGILSKRLSAPYRSGRSPDWLKVKKPRQSSYDPGAGS
jgi:bifunctional non-homologous end joining protein LigD